MTTRRFAVASIVAAAALRLVLAPLRTLSADEAYYLWASRTGLPWKIDDHPPLLGVLLRSIDATQLGPVELRVRLVAVVLQLGTALGLARLARKTAPTEGAETAGACAAILATWGLMPTAGGLLATPDAPLLCSLAWLLPTSLDPAGPQRDVTLAALATMAALSKAVALPLLVVLAAAHFARRSYRTAASLVAGGAIGVPFAWPSLRLQLAHAAGSGPFVSAPRTGPLLALFVLVVGQLLLWSPPIVWLGVRTLRDRSVVVGDRWLVFAVAGAVAASAVLSGRPPEPNWTAPALLVVLVAASLALVDRIVLRRVVVAVAAAPALVAMIAWALPIDRGPLARVPRPNHGPPSDAPDYGVASWRCIYDHRCEEIDVISRR